jgi:hypothetical protein
MSFLHSVASYYFHPSFCSFLHDFGFRSLEMGEADLN